MRVKVILVGPCKAGKTYIANTVSEAVENADTEYRATQGVRILEYEPPSTIANKIEVELWDCSGDTKFETTWPAFQHGAHGVVLVLDSSKSDCAKSAERFSTLLSNKPPGLSHCMILLMGSGPANLKLTGAWTQAKQVKVDLAKDGGQALKREMANFVANLAETARATNDREEFSIVGLN